MNLKQKILKQLYPLLMFFLRRASQHGRVLKNLARKHPQQSIYDLEVFLNNGTRLPLGSLRGKKVLLVNTASECGYTSQLAPLQQLADQYAGQLAIIGFPANDFKDQEQGNDSQIAQFCSRNFGVRFPLAKKGKVAPGADQNPVYAWLTQAAQNGWNNQAPDWNFSKYLVNENGMLTHYFGPAVSPLEPEVRNAVES